MRIAILEAVYDYRMSYLNEWRTAWASVADSVLPVNVLKASSLKTFSSEIQSVDVIVGLHSLTADSNNWLPKLQKVLERRKQPFIMHIGNEYSNPWLSMNKRLQSLGSVQPEIIATQLNLDAGKWLYRSTRAEVVSGLHALPTSTIPSVNISKRIDIGIRGFRYPWYLLDEERNDVIHQVTHLAKALGLRIDSSESHRFNQIDWYRFLGESRVTVSSEAGSKYVFDTDDVWKEALERIIQIGGFRKSISNDAIGMGIARLLPGSIKRLLRQASSTIGIEQGAVAELDSKYSSEIQALIDPTAYDHVNGKAVSSRHFDAIASGTWQILAPGRYGDVLRENLHYSPWSIEAGPEVIVDALQASVDGRTLQAYESIRDGNQYSDRVRDILSHVPRRFSN